MIRLLSLLFLCLTLLGCDAESDTPAPVFSQQQEAQVLLPLSEENTDADVYCLKLSQITGMRPLGDAVLLFSGEDSTTLTVLEGEPPAAVANTSLSFLLDPQDASVRMGKKEFSFFDPVTREIVVMSRRLQEIRRIRAPGDLIGTPILSDDGSKLFYCTSEALRVWELDSGIRRTLVEMPCTEQTLSGLYMDSSVVECRISDAQATVLRFLSAEDGHLLQETEELTLTTRGSAYCAAFPNRTMPSVVFAQAGQTPMVLNPKAQTDRLVCPEQPDQVLGICSRSDGSICLDVYRLESGLCISSLSLPFRGEILTALCNADDEILLLMETAQQGLLLIRWEPGLLPVGDETVYSGPFYTRENPDLEGLARCREEARRISESYGIHVKIGEDAVDPAPWDYALESEYLVPVIQDSLRLLEAQLKQYPVTMLQQTAEHFSSLSICLVRSITGTAESGSLNTATGVQFLDGTDAYVVIAGGEFARQALYHELFHVMETHLLTHSIALDRWDQLNPSGFSYDYSYLTNAERNSGIYLHQEDRAFIDTYSMSYPKEDRARIMEYAMLPGNAALFRSPILQAKLAALCDGIREAYGLQDGTEVLLWEQYLDR